MKFWWLIIQLFWQLIKQKRLIVKEQIPIQNGILKRKPSEQLSKSFKRSNEYYALLFSGWIFKQLSVLDKGCVKDDELKINTLISAMVSIVDDIFDQEGSVETLEKLIDNPLEKTPTNSHVVALQEYLKKIIEFDGSHIWSKSAEWIPKVIQSQQESLKQINGELSKLELYEITKNKGGTALLFLFPETPVVKFDFLFQFGFVMQLANDIMDIEKDRKANIQTLPLELNNIEMAELYKTELNILQNTCNLLIQNEKHKKSFWENVLIIYLQPLIFLMQRERGIYDNRGMLDWKNLTELKKIFNRESQRLKRK